MANTPLKNRKLSPWVTEAVKHRRWLEDRLHPTFKVTAARYSEEWMDEVWTRSISQAGRRAAERLFIEKLLRIKRQRIIDKVLAKANKVAERYARRRQYRKQSPLEEILVAANHQPTKKETR